MTKQEVVEFYWQFDSLDEESNYGPEGLWIHPDKWGSLLDKPKSGTYIGFCGDEKALTQLRQLFPSYHERNKDYPKTVYILESDLLTP